MQLRTQVVRDVVVVPFVLSLQPLLQPSSSSFLYCVHACFSVFLGWDRDTRRSRVCFLDRDAYKDHV